MNAANVELLRQAGVDYPAGVARFMGDTALYETVLSAFLRDKTLETAQSAYRSGDQKALFDCAHEVKGSSGNTDMTALYAASCALVELLRGGGPADGGAVGVAFDRFQAAYTAARRGVRSALEGS